MRGRDGVSREAHVIWDEDDPAGPAIILTVFNDTEHALVPLDRHEAQRLAAWIVAHVGLPPGFTP
jgi:hypothetical protein